eukprot:TRINITY_DN11736_c0_g1_i1.p1 TRINITY_DN11736_c0_g1~~TRINITY_DN11736_c0_g1_i1.p1  ORF type:complete len:237 (-),score=18.00 TRINITY_DN11736_c0_g1_i1:64-774(-)
MWNSQDQMKEGKYEVRQVSGVHIFLFLILVISLATFSICIWVRFDLDFWEWVQEIKWYSYWNAMYVIMTALLIKSLVCLAGGWSVYTEHRFGLLLSTATHILLFILHSVGAAIICVYGVEDSHVLKNELHEVLMGLVYAWDSDPRASRILKIIQEYVGCCGATGGSDFLDVFKDIPSECRHPVTGNEFNDGCEQALAWWLEPWTATLAGSSVFLACADVALIIFYIRLTRRLDRKL